MLFLLKAPLPASFPPLPRLRGDTGGWDFGGSLPKTLLFGEIYRFFAQFASTFLNPSCWVCWVSLPVSATGGTLYPHFSSKRENSGAFPAQPNLHGQFNFYYRTHVKMERFYLIRNRIDIANFFILSPII